MTPTPTPLPASVLLPIEPRAYDQEDFCGEVCIQEALRHFGKDVPQLEINRVGGGDGVQGLWSEGIETMLKNIKFGYRSWRLESPDYAQYVEMLKGKLAQGHPILVGVKINPTQHPDWFCDHFILLVGYNSDSFIYNSPDTREQRSFVQFRDGDPDGSGWTLTNPFNLFFGVEFIGE